MGNARTGWNVVGVTAAVVLLVALGAATANAQETTCGETVTQDTTLQDDLVDCPSGKNGLTIGADGVTVDLNGHKIIGKSGSATGIDNSYGHNGVKIIGDGFISGFTDGLEIRDSRSVQVSGLTIQGNARIGLRVSNSRNGRFSNMRVVSNQAGGAAFGDGADNNEIRSVSFIRNGADGLVVSGDANTVAGNWATANAGDGGTASWWGWERRVLSCRRTVLSGTTATASASSPQAPVSRRTSHRRTQSAVSTPSKARRTRAITRRAATVTACSAPA